MNKILVTGADGFIGRNLVNALIRNKNNDIYAIVYSNMHIFDKITSNRLHVFNIDLNSIMDYLNLFPDDIDILYHFAWIGVDPQSRDLVDVQMKNISMTIECMKFASCKCVNKVIFPGSTNEYLYYGKPINKDAVPSPNNMYGATKVALRYICAEYAKKNNIQFIYAIITGIYAADRKDNNVIFYTIDKLLHDESPKLTRLEQLWDYVYIDDVVDAFICIGKNGKDGAVYAIGHGDNWKLSNYIDIIHKKINPQLPLGIGEIPYNSDSLPSSCIDLSDLKNDTGFVPRVSFEEGIERVIAKMKEELEK